MNWSRVPIFLKVVETESITRAAELLRLPKSSVSRAVSALEKDLASQLLTRTTRQVKLTDAGRHFYERARAARAALEEAEAGLEHRDDDAQGLVRISVASSAVPLADLFARFTAEHPKVHVEVVVTNRHVNLVDEGIDLALRAGAMPDSTHVARKLFSDDFGLFASPAYLKKRGTPKRLDDLRKHDVVLFRPKAGENVLELMGPDGPASVAVKGRVSADDLEFLRAFVTLGAGIALMPTLPGRQALTRVLPAYGVKGRGLHLVMPAARFVPTRVRLLSKFIVENFHPGGLCAVARTLNSGRALRA